MNYLPTEILLKIMEHCRMDELNQLRQASRRLEKITDKYHANKVVSLSLRMEEKMAGQTLDGQFMMEKILKANIQSAFPIKEEKMTCKEHTDEEAIKFIEDVFNQAGSSPTLIMENIPLNQEILETIQNTKFNFGSVKTLQLLHCSFELADLCSLISLLSRMRLHEFKYSSDGEFVDLTDEVYRTLSCNFSVDPIPYTTGTCLSLTDNTLNALMERPQHIFQLTGIATSFSVAKIVELIELGLSDSFRFRWDFGILNQGIQDEIEIEKLRQLPEIKYHTEDEKYTRTRDHVITSRYSIFKFKTRY